MKTTHPIGAQALSQRRRDAGPRLARVFGAMVCAAWFSLWATTGVRAEPLELPPGSWSFGAKGNFTGRLDRRHLYRIAHPLEAAKAGDYGRIERQIVIPRTMKPPYTLRFYVSDNVYGEGHTKKWSVADVRVGHRFKQALVDGKVVWSQDIAVNLPVNNQRYTLVDITPHVRAGQEITLAFQLRQEVDSHRQMPKDLIKLGTYAATTKQYQPLPREKFGTHSYWGDVAIHAGPPPAADELTCRWEPPLKEKSIQFPRVAPAVREQAALKVECRRSLAGSWSWPVSQGIPLPMGALEDVKNMALYRPAGDAVCARFTPMNRWPDGSLRWVLADFPLPPGAGGEYKLEWGREVTVPPATPTNPVLATDDFKASNGLVWARWTLDEAGVPRDLVIGRSDDQVVISGQRPYLNFKDKALTPKWLEGRWLSRSPLRAEMQVAGELVAVDGDRYGTCRLRLALFAGSPLIRLMYTIVNERIDAVPEDEPDDAALKRTRLFSGSKVRPLTAVVTSYGLRLLVPGAQARETGPGWLAVEGQGGGVTGALRYFKHIWPVGLECQADGIDLQFFKPGDKRMPTYGTFTGEAKTQEVWLALTDRAAGADVAANLARRVEKPPRLDTSALIRDSHAWGTLPYVGTDKHAAEYAMIIERYLDPWYTNTHQDIRHYGGYSGNNFYWNRLHSIYMLYAMTGERKWYDRAERSNRHYMDVCTLNWWPDGSKVGAKVRNTEKFFAVYLVHQNPHPMLDHWNLTGDPDGLRIGRANADFIAGNKEMRAHTDGKSARQQGWPLMAMVRAWQETGDQRYADQAKHIVDVAINHMERRRGAYLQRHGSNSHLGIVPFMTGILCSGLRQYHFWSGDDRAGVALVQNAMAMFIEMHDPARSKTLPNLDYYYSPNPYLRGGDGKTPIAHLNPNIASAQAYASILTDDPELADIAWRTWQAYMQTAGWNQNSYDFLYDFPAALYWLDKAPVPDRATPTKLPRFWRHAVGAPEIWINRPDAKPFTVQIRWSVYEQPFQRGQPLRQWPEYCRRLGLKGEIQLLGPEDAPIASAPMDLSETPHGTSVTLQTDRGGPGLYRIVVRGVVEAPIRLIMEDLSPHVKQWGVPIDRGWINAASEYCFRVPLECREISVRYGLLTPWEKISLELENPQGQIVREFPHRTMDPWKPPWLTWQVPVPAEAQNGLWRFRQAPPASTVLRIDGASPLVSLTPDACFLPARVPSRLHPETTDAPAGWGHGVATIEAGKRLSIPRGEPTGDSTYEHVNVHQGTVEFWMRADTSDDTMEGFTYLRFGSLHLWRRTQVGTYLNLGKGFLQSGFLFRPRAWYHVALTWHLGDETREPVLSLLVNGVPVIWRMQTRLPADTGDWTGEALQLGGTDPMRITGLRISAVQRDEELQRGVLSPPPDAQTLYWQHAESKP